MQALRHASRLTLHASVVIQNARAATVKGFSYEAASSVAARKSKGERYDLAKQFVAKFKAANDGQLPGITLLRKEVGGKYETLKEVLQELSKGEDAVGGTKEVFKENLKVLEAVKEAGAEGQPQEVAAATRGRSKRKSTVKGEGTAAVTDDTKGPDTLKHTAQLKDTEGEIQEVAASAKDGSEKKATGKGGDPKKDKKETPPVSKGKETPQVSKISKNVITVEELLHKSTAKDEGQTLQPVTAAKKVSNPAMDRFLTSDEDDDDDSDVAAPEYHHTSLTQKAGHKVEVGVKAEGSKEKTLENVAVASAKMDMKKQIDSQAMKSKAAGIKRGDQGMDSALKGREAVNPVVISMAAGMKHGDQGMDSALKGREPVNPVVISMDEETKHPMTDDSFSAASKSGVTLLTTVARILNLPSYMTESKLRTLCELAGKVHSVEYRRGRIADVQFDVDLHEMSHVMNRLRALSLGSQKMRVCPAQKFLCENNPDSKFKPRDMNHYKQVRNVLIFSLEQRFKFLSRQVEDYRELQDLKLAK